MANQGYYGYQPEGAFYTQPLPVNGQLNISQPIIYALPTYSPESYPMQDYSLGHDQPNNSQPAHTQPNYSQPGYDQEVSQQYPPPNYSQVELERAQPNTK